jgi:hypothetical protein
MARPVRTMARLGGWPRQQRLRRARASGYNASASAYQRGGAGGYGLGEFGRGYATGGAGASSTLTNVVSGSTTGGTLFLRQVAKGGGAGGSGRTPGAARNASSSLTFDDTKNTTHASDHLMPRRDDS